MKIEDDFVFHPFHCAYVADTIDRLILADKKVAIERRENFWTIGMSTYKDGYKDLDAAQVKDNNLMMWAAFGDLLRFQLEWFEDLLKAEVDYFPNLPLPGFHVFKYCKEFEQPLARPHVDVPFNKYDWGKRVGYDGIFTWVVPVEVPEGAGMFVWDLDAMDMHKMGAEVVVAQARATDPALFVEHKVDRMCLHSGKWVHMIKPFEKETDSMRITLQGHAVFIDGVWRLYW